MFEHSEIVRRVQESASVVQRAGSVPMLPPPRRAVSIRVGTADDAAFIDSLQREHRKMVGWFPKSQLQSYIDGGHVLVAEEVRGQKSEVRGQKPAAGAQSEELTSDLGPLTSVPLGYIIAKDRYMKRDDVGIVYQLNVAPSEHRNLIGATLVKAAFERAAYGCRLFSCWCAQDIPANHFWESIGFVPLAFRTGSRGKKRVHIFWQRRIREGDDRTPWWFPYQTQGGAVREDRIVLPIPPDTHWSDAKPLVLPDEPGEHARLEAADTPKTLPGGAPVRPRPAQPQRTPEERAAIMRAQSAHLKGVPLGKKAIISGGRIRYVDREDFVPGGDDDNAAEALTDEPAKRPRKPRPRPRKQRPRPRRKHDAKIVEQARELRDRYLEAVNAPGKRPAARGVGRREVRCQPGAWGG